MRNERTMVKYRSPLKLLDKTYKHDEEVYSFTNREIFDIMDILNKVRR